MKITVINGTEKHGVTYKLKEMFLDELRDGTEITEFYLPKDCPNFCVGCTTCFLTDEHKCKDAENIRKIEQAMFDADILVFTTPVYVFHATGAMKALLDHFGYRWMPHRPAKEMFSKRAVIITQSLGSGEKSAAKDIKDSLSWWGVSQIYVCALKLMDDIQWDKIQAKRRAKFTLKLVGTAQKLKQIDYNKPATIGFSTKMKFYIVRLMQKKIKKTNPDSLDASYWKDNGWLGSARPWKE